MKNTIKDIHIASIKVILYMLYFSVKIRRLKNFSGQKVFYEDLENNIAKMWCWALFQKLGDVTEGMSLFHYCQFPALKFIQYQFPLDLPRMWL